MATLAARINALAQTIGTQIKNLVLNKANLTGADFGGPISAPVISTTVVEGYVELRPGGQERTGYISFYNKSGGRHGYIGFADTNTITIGAELGHFNFNGTTPTVNDNTIWHAGNFDPNSKLDVNTGGEVIGGLYTKNRMGVSNPNTASISSPFGNLAGLEITGNNDPNSAAFMQFHRPGAYASYFGLDTDNQWKVGGWSAGAVAYKLAHEGNLNDLKILSYTTTGTGEFFVKADGYIKLNIPGLGKIKVPYVTDQN